VFEKLEKEKKFHDWTWAALNLQPSDLRSNSRVKTHSTIEELCKSDGTTTSLHPEMVNLFYDYFSSVFTSEDDFVPVPQTNSSPSIIDTLVITPQIVLTKLK